jgi:hypothetical protein
MRRRWKSNREAGKAPRLNSGYRSGLEEKIANDLDTRKVAYEYETVKIKYSVPERIATYTPDFILPNGIIVEGKGIFDTADRQKHLLVRDQHPEKDIRFVFSRSAAPIYKGSKTTLAAWCAKHSFRYADKLIPLEWIWEEPRA